ncbi:MAG: hypothetical protein Q7T11_00540 [Deltaproteobacteria bacterium]|nr:hypothetical protein [Deltaproteobacteria bacterium]
MNGTGRTNQTTDISGAEDGGPGTDGSRVTQLRKQYSKLMAEAHAAGLKSGEFAAKAAGAGDAERGGFIAQSQHWSDVAGQKEEEAANVKREIGQITANEAAADAKADAACARKADEGPAMPESGNYKLSGGHYFNQKTYADCMDAAGRAGSLKRAPAARLQSGGNPALTKSDLRRLTDLMTHGLDLDRSAHFSPEERQAIVNALHGEENNLERPLTEKEVDQAMIELAALRRNLNHPLTASEIKTAINMSLQTMADLPPADMQMGPGKAFPE